TPCHLSLRSGSGAIGKEILRFAQDDIVRSLRMTMRALSRTGLDLALEQAARSFASLRMTRRALSRTARRSAGQGWTLPKEVFRARFASKGRFNSQSLCPVTVPGATGRHFSSIE